MLKLQDVKYTVFFYFVFKFLQISNNKLFVFGFLFSKIITWKRNIDIKY